MPLEEETRKVGEEARRLGLDLVGFASVARLEGELPASLRLSRLGEHFLTLVVVGRHGYRGLALAHHGGTRQFWGGRLLKRVEESTLKLADSLERLGHNACPLPATAVDFGEGEGLDLCPAGQGSRLLQLAAVQAGLGTLGLNGMLLTPRFGPRIFLGGVLTDHALEWGEPLAEELCPGLEDCGRCAAVCPEEAIPRECRQEAPLEEYRDLDRRACARSSQPLAARSFKRYLVQILEQKGETERMWEQIGSRRTGAYWQEMIMIKEGAFTGCSACTLVCPVGEDYAPLAQRIEATLPSFEVRRGQGRVQLVKLAPEGGLS